MKLLLLFFIFISACSKNNNSTTKVKFIAAATIDSAKSSGGVFVRATNSDTSQSDIHEVTQSGEVEVINGNYTFDILTFDGSQKTYGSPRCGTSSNVSLNGETQSITIEANKSKCFGSVSMSLFVDQSKFSFGSAPSSFLVHLGTTTLGSSPGNNFGGAMAKDAYENYYILSGGVTTLGDDTVGGAGDIVIFKMDRYGQLVRTFQLGTTRFPNNGGVDQGQTIHSLTNGDFIISGMTASSLGETNSGGNDIFVARFDRLFNLKWIRQLGNVTIGINAMFADEPCGLGIDNSGNIHVAGYTAGNLFDTNSGNDDIVYFKLNSNGELIFSKQYTTSVTGINDASGDDECRSAFLDADRNIFIITFNTAGNLITANAGSLDAGVLIVSGADGSVQGSFMGGTAVAEVDDKVIKISNGNYIYLGHTSGALLEGNAGGEDVYLKEFTSTGSIVNSKQWGSVTLAAGGANDQAKTIVQMANGNLAFTGETASSLGETNGGLDDIMIGEISVTSLTPITIKQIGSVTGGAFTTNIDAGRPILLGNNGEFYIAGETASSLDGEGNGGGRDVFFAKYDTAFGINP